MKRSAYVAVGAVVLMMAAGAVFAMEGEQLTAKVPFQFTVSEETLPPGTYTIGYAQFDDENSMAIRSADGKAEVTFFVEDASAKEAAKKTELVFDEIGKQHFLKQIWVAGEDRGHELALTKAEKELMGKGNKKSEHRLEAEHTAHKTAMRQ